MCNAVVSSVDEIVLYYLLLNYVIKIFVTSIDITITMLGNKYFYNIF